jgi:hypothetical protein
MRKNQPLLILGAGLVLLAMAVVVIFLLTGNNDGGPDVSKTVNNNKGPASTGGTLGGPEPIVQLPASRYIPLITEVPGHNEVNVSDTFTMNITTFTSSYWFINDQEGQDRAREWKIVDGYQVYYQPVGLSAQVLQGDFYTTIETYLFADVEGARGAYAHLAKKIGSLPGTEVEKARGLANESSAYSLVQGTIGVSEVVAVYHRFIFRRGNAVVSVQTYGGELGVGDIHAAIDDRDDDLVRACVDVPGAGGANEGEILGLVGGVVGVVRQASGVDRRILHRGDDVRPGAEFGQVLVGGLARGHRQAAETLFFQCGREAAGAPPGRNGRATRSCRCRRRRTRGAPGRARDRAPRGRRRDGQA